MTIIVQDNKIRNVRLTGDEIDLIKDQLKQVPHSLYIFLNNDKIIKKLNDALKEIKK